ncbi:MAG: hypothetical protein RL104_269 [Bacteroidota bacterium]
MGKTARKYKGARTPQSLKEVRASARRNAVQQPQRTAAKSLVAKALEVLSIPYVEGLAFATLVHASQALMLMSTGVIGFIGLSRFKND